jgi:DNA-binding transcriptional MerR regulator
MGEKFLIGEIARLTGSSASSMRFYESRGLLSPDKDGENQYRLYAPEESANLLLAKLYRSLGFSVDELRALGGASSYEDVTRGLRDRANAVAEEIERLSSVYDEACALSSQTARAAACVAGYWIEDESPFYKVSTIKDHGLVLDSARQRITSRWMTYLPALGFSVFVSQSALRGEVPFGCEWGFSLRPEVAERFADPLEPPIERRSGGLCLSTAIERRSANDLEAWELEPVIEEMSRRGLEPADDGFGRLFCSCRSKGETIYLLDFHIPVKKYFFPLTFKQL